MFYYEFYFVQLFTVTLKSGKDILHHHQMGVSDFQLRECWFEKTHKYVEQIVDVKQKQICPKSLSPKSHPGLVKVLVVQGVVDGW